MVDFKTYTEAVTMVSRLVDFRLCTDSRERVMGRVRNSLSFYQTAATAINPTVQRVSYDAALRELRAAMEHLNGCARFCKWEGWKPLSL